MIAAIRNKIKSIPSWIYWLFMAVMLLFIIIFNDVWDKEDSFIVLSLFYYIILFVSIVRWIFKQTKIVLALRRDKVNMEMLHLKSQVNPHFFFNTLNNLYGLVKKDPEQAQDLILKLSEMMRYSIYEGQSDWVPLEEEITYLKNYLELHRSRYHKKVSIEFDTSIDRDGYNIMPLLLILLVENAIKHGVEKLRDDAYVNINLNAKNDIIDFIISNNFDTEEQDSAPGGIGLSNLKRRLEIGYKKEFKLDLKKETSTFIAQLSLHKV